MIAGRLEIEAVMNLAKISRDVQHTKGLISGLARDMDRAVGDMKRMFGGVGAAIAAAFSVRQILVMTDQFAKFNAQLRLATGSQQEYGIAVSEVRRISQLAQQGLEQTGVLYARITNSTRELGLSQKRTSDITETVSLALKVSGATAQESASAMLQLSQAFASGMLRGEEFNAVNEAAPRLMRALAEGMGVPVGALREMAKEGLITSQVMAEALPKALGALREEASSVQTLGGAFTVLRNGIMEFVGTAGEASGIVSLLSASLRDMGTILGEVNKQLPEANKAASLGLGDWFSLSEAFRAVVVLGGNVAFVLKAIGLEIGGLAAQAAALATGDFAAFAEIGRQMKADAAANRAEFDKWEAAIMAAGKAASVAKPLVESLTEEQYEQQRIAAANVKLTKEQEAAAKAAAKARAEAEKQAAAERMQRAQAEIDAEEMFARDYFEAWEAVYKQRNAEAARAQAERNAEAARAQAERNAMAEAEIKAEEMAADDFREAWEAYSRFQIKEGEKQNEIVRQQARMWDDLAGVAGDFFADLVMNGKSAFDNLRQWAKQLLADMIAIFAKRWILNLAAGGTVMGSAGDALASTVGGGPGSSLGGSLLSTGASWAGNALAGAAGFTGLGTWATFAGAASGAIPAAAIGSGAVAAGVGVNTFAATAGSALSGVYTALASIPVWGWIAMAVIAIGAWIAGNHKGGPKVGGSFMGGFDSSGAFTGTVGVPGSDNGRFFTPNQGDDALRSLVEGTARGYIQAITALGGTAGAFNFGLGFDHDPAGTAQSRVSSMLTDANGRVIYSNLDRSMDDKEVDQALQLEAQRMLLAALQQAELPDAVAEILNSIVASGASGEEIQRVIAMAIEMKQVLDGLAAIDLKGLDITALKAWQRDGESIGQTFQRVAQQWGDFNAAFLTDDQKLAATWEQIVAVFGQLGVAVPESNEAFLALVSGIDLSTEAGRRMWDMLHDVAPAFAAVENAVSGMVASIIANLRGPMDPQSALNAELDTFIANNPWAQGMSRDYVMQQLLTITPDDLASYIRAGQGSNLGAISELYRQLQGGSGGMGAVGGVNINDAQVEATIAAREFAEALREAKASLGDYLDASLLSDLSPLDPMQKLEEARKQFEATLALAQGGDLEAIGALGSRRDVYLDIARDIFASSSAFGDIFRTTFDQVAGVAGVDSYNERMLTISERQVTLQEMVANTLDRIARESREDASYMTIQVTGAVREVRDAVRETSTELR